MSLRFFAILTACVAVALMLNQPLATTVVEQTGRELDVAIVGQGYFQIMDFESGETRYTRHGRLEINSSGQLVMKIDRKTWIIDPPFSLPSDWERIDIQNNGSLQYLSNTMWMSAGQMQLARFSTTPPFSDPFTANKLTDTTNSPMVGNPGMNGMGTLQQRWLERPSATKVQVAAHLLIGFLVSLVINALIDRPRK